MEVRAGLREVLPDSTSALTLKRLVVVVVVVAAAAEEGVWDLGEGNFKESGLGRNDFGSLEVSGVGCGENPEIPFARRDAIVVAVALRRSRRRRLFFILVSSRVG